MTTVYRLHSSRYPPNSGDGAALYGGRWNPKGIPVIYAAASPSLAALEVMVNYSVLPTDFVMTLIAIPRELGILTIPEAELPEGWDRPIPSSATQEYGAMWISAAIFPVLKVPSSVMPLEANYVINVRHQDFQKIRFGPSAPFQFDSRLTRLRS